VDFNAQNTIVTTYNFPSPPISVIH